MYVVCTVDSSPEVLCLSKHQCLKGKGFGGIGNPGIARASTLLAMGRLPTNARERIRQLSHRGGIDPEIIEALNQERILTFRQTVW